MMKNVVFFCCILFLFFCPVSQASPYPLAIRYEFQGNEAHVFFSDLLGSGNEQKIMLERLNEKMLEGTAITIRDTDNNSVFSLDVIGGYIGQSFWYITHLRGTAEPELVYFFVDGTGNYLNDFKIIGTLPSGSLGVLFDINALPPDRLPLGANCTLTIKQAGRTELLLNSNTGYMSIYWKDGAFACDSGCTCPLNKT